MPQIGLEDIEDIELKGRPMRLDLGRMNPVVINLRDSTDTTMSRPSRGVATGDREPTTGRSARIAANLLSLGSGRNGGSRYDEHSSARGVIDYWNQ